MEKSVLMCKCIVTCLLSLSLCAALTAAQELPSQDHESNYFIGTPENTTVSFNRTEEGVFGDFRCATRLGYRPLWIVNGISWELIREQTAGYGDTYIELIPLPGDGNLLSFISIPASAATNNSVVSCAALENETILAYSQPAHMIVLVQDMPSDVSTSQSPPNSSAPTSETGPTVESPGLKGSTIKWIICLSVVCGSLICIAVVTFVSVLVFVALRRRQSFKKINILNKGKRQASNNIYCAEDGKVLGENKIFWEQQTEKKLAANESL